MASGYLPSVRTSAPAEQIEAAAALLGNAKHPVILAGRMSRDLEAWNARVRLAERLGAQVVTDLKVSASFPTDHRLHAGAPGTIAPTPAGDTKRCAPPTLFSASIGSILLAR